MKKNYKLVIVSLLLGSLTYAQVGLGTATPSAGLDVVSQGNTNATKALEINNSANTEMVTVLNNGNVGIGNTAPATKLDINNGTTAGAVKIVDGTQGAGKVLTSDANGVATWSTPATSLYFLAASPGSGGTDFTGTTNPVPGAAAESYYRFLTTAVPTNLGPTATYTSGSAGISYRIPIKGIYRLTLYVDQVMHYTTSTTPSTVVDNRMAITSYRGGTQLFRNIDYGNNTSLVMICIWNLDVGDYVLPVSTFTPPTAGQMFETTFTVERVN